MPGPIKGSTTFLRRLRSSPKHQQRPYNGGLADSYAAVTKHTEPLGEPSPSLVQDIAAWYIGVLQEPCITSKDG